mgnify:CR=1 FL=1
MIIEGGIYSKDKEIRIVVTIDDDIINYYSIKFVDFNETYTRKKVERRLKEDWLWGFISENFHSIFDESFKSMYDGYLGKIDEALLSELQKIFEVIMFSREVTC